MISVTLPLRLVSEANSHTHWRIRQRRAASQHAAVGMALWLEIVARLQRGGAEREAARFAMGDPRIMRDMFRATSLVTTITRIAPCKLDSDNAVGAAKHVRDAVAKVLGVDDRDERVEWRVEQRKGGVREYAVRIDIEARNA